MSRIIYNFSSSGAAEVVAAFKSIEQAARGASIASRQFAGQGIKLRAMPGGASRTGGGRGPSPEREAAAAARKEQSRLAALNRQRSREWNAEFRKEERDKERAAKGEQRRQAKTASDAKRLREKAIKDRERESKRDQKRQDDAMRRQKRAQEKLWNERAKSIAGMGGAAQWMGRKALHAAAIVGGAGLVAGGAALRQTLDLQNMASKVAVQGREHGKDVGDARAIRRGWEDAAIRTPGAKASEIGAAVSQFTTRTGRLDVAQQWQEQMAEIMVATDVAGADLGNTMATLFQKFGVQGTADMQQALADLMFQGKKGAFELSDMASHMAEIGAAAERYGGLKGVGGVRKLGGIMQIARGSTGEAAEAKTAIEAMFRQIIAKSGDIKSGAKFDIWEKGKKGLVTKDINEVLIKTISGFKGQAGPLNDVFDVRGVKAISPLIDAFKQASKDGQDVAAGERAMRDMLAEAATTGANYSDVLQDAAIRGQGAGAQLDTAWESFAALVGDSLEPAAQSLATALQNLATSDSFGIVLEGLAEGAASFIEAMGEGIDAITGKLIEMGAIKQEDVDRRRTERERGRAARILDKMDPEQRAGLERMVAGYAGEDYMTPEVMARIGESMGYDPRQTKAAYQMRQNELEAGGVNQFTLANQARPEETGWQDLFDAMQLAQQMLPGGGITSLIRPSSDTVMSDKDMAKTGVATNEAAGQALADLQKQATNAAAALAMINGGGGHPAPGSVFTP